MGADAAKTTTTPPPPPPQKYTHTSFIILLTCCLFTRPSRSVMWLYTERLGPLGWDGHVSNWALAGHLLLPSEQEEKQKTATSSVEAMGKSEMPLQLAASEGKKMSKSHLIHREGSKKRKALACSVPTAGINPAARDSGSESKRSHSKAGCHPLSLPLPVSKRAAS